MYNKPSPIHSTLAAILLPLGGLLILGMKLGGAMLLRESGSSMASVFLFLLMGAALWVWGFTHLAIALKLNPAYGMLGIFFLIGLWILLWVAKKQPEWDRAAARHRARHGKQPGHRGDPNSLY